MTVELAIQEIRRAELGQYTPTLADGLRWEALGLGRVRFVRGVATWVR